MTATGGHEEVRRRYPMPVSEARLAHEHAVFIVADTETDERYAGELRENARSRGYRSVIAVPMLHDGNLVATTCVTRRDPGEWTQEEVALLRTFADQAVIAIENVRLFTELQQKNRALTEAHARISEALDQQTATAEILRVISSSPTDIQPVFDAIVESAVRLCDGRFAAGWRFDGEEIHFVAHHDVPTDALELQRRAFPAVPARAGIIGRAVIDGDVAHVADVETDPTRAVLARRGARHRRSQHDLRHDLDDALMLVRERASRRGISVDRVMDERLGVIRADERKVKQVLLNLLSNAVKFTAEGGKIDVCAAVNGGMAEISVTDTGIGIAPEDQASVFEEFRQVGSAAKKIKGTGLGLTLCRKFVELHGGRIWVKSQAGQGSTFTFTLPTRPLA